MFGYCWTITIFLFPLPFSLVLCLCLSPFSPPPLHLPLPVPSSPSWSLPFLHPVVRQNLKSVCGSNLESRLAFLVQRSHPKIGILIIQSLNWLSLFQIPVCCCVIEFCFSGQSTVGRSFFSTYFYNECCCSRWISAWRLLYVEDIYLMHVIPQGPKSGQCYLFENDA